MGVAPSAVRLLADGAAPRDVRREYERSRCGPPRSPITPGPRGQHDERRARFRRGRYDLPFAVEADDVAAVEFVRLVVQAESHRPVDEVEHGVSAGMSVRHDAVARVEAEPYRPGPGVGEDVRVRCAVEVGEALDARHGRFSPSVGLGRKPPRSTSAGFRGMRRGVPTAAGSGLPRTRSAAARFRPRPARWCSNTVYIPSTRASRCPTGGERSAVVRRVTRARRTSPPSLPPRGRRRNTSSGPLRRREYLFAGGASRPSYDPARTGTI